VAQKKMVILRGRTRGLFGAAACQRRSQRAEAGKYNLNEY